MRRKQLTETEKQELIGLKHSGATYSELAKKYRISARRAMQIVKNANKKPEIIDVNQPTPSAEEIKPPEISQPPAEEQSTPQLQGETLVQNSPASVETPQPQENKLDEILPLTDEDKKYSSAEELGAPKLQPEISQGNLTNSERTAAAESAARFVCDTLNIICDSQLKKPLSDSEKKTMISYGKSFWVYYLPEQTNNKTVVALMYGGAIIGVALARKDEIKTVLEKRKQAEQKAA